MSDLAGAADQKAWDWKLWDYRGTGRWPEKWPPVEYRRIDDTHMEFRVTPSEDAGNTLGGLHGGFLASYAETTLGIFVVPFDLPVDTVTVSLSFDYPAGGKVGEVIEGVARLVRETRRMQFIHIELKQRGEPILIGSGVLRKVPRA